MVGRLCYIVISIMHVILYLYDEEPWYRPTHWDTHEVVLDPTLVAWDPTHRARSVGPNVPGTRGRDTVWDPMYRAHQVGRGTQRTGHAG